MILHPFSTVRKYPEKQNPFDNFRRFLRSCLELQLGAEAGADPGRAEDRCSGRTGPPPEVNCQIWRLKHLFQLSPHTRPLPPHETSSGWPPSRKTIVLSSQSILWMTKKSSLIYCNTNSFLTMNDSLYSLNHLQESLRKAEQSYDSASDNHDQGTLKAVSRLLHTLLGHDVSFALHSKTGSGDLVSELATLFRRVGNGDFNYQQYRPLSLLVIKNASDLDIWNAVFDLIRSVSRKTPPTSIPPSFNGTPVIYSSASMQGDEQTKRLLEISLFDEIKNCTYRNVGDFFTKYFEGREWSKQSKEIYEAVKDRHVDSRRIKFPDPPDEGAVWEWLLGIQDEYLTNACGIYYTTSAITELVGAEARRQLDFFVKRRTDAVDTSHDWKDVRVIGEHRVSQKEWKRKFLQIGRYVRDVFSVQPTRRFVHAFTLLGATMELWVFDR